MPTQKQSPLNLVYAADGGFAMPLAVSVFSMLRRTTPGRAVNVYIVDGGFTGKQRRKIERVARRGGGARALTVEWIRPDPAWWSGAAPDFSGKNLNETVLYRLGIPHFLPESAERAVYLDADVLAKADPADLETQIEPGYGVSAVQDYSMASWGQRYRHRPDSLAALGLTGEEPYFNAGVLGINVAYWRDHDIAGRAARFLVDHQALAGFYDQDALNYVLRDHWRAIDPGWNFPPRCDDKVNRLGLTLETQVGLTFDQLRGRARLVHFTGAKPWHQGFTNPERPGFINELKRSRWFSPAGYAAWSLRWYGRLLGRAWHKYRRQRLALPLPGARRRTAVSR